MKYLIIPIQNFSAGVKQQKNKDNIHLLPEVIQLFLSYFGSDIFCVLDESSWIKSNTYQKKQQSMRSRMVIFLGSLCQQRAIATGTLMSKGPMNIYNQFMFLNPAIWNDYKNAREFMSAFTIMKDYEFNNRRTLAKITKEDYARLHRELVKFMEDKPNANDIVAFAMRKSISPLACYAIWQHEEYYPYYDVNRLLDKIEPITITVKREDIFDTEPDRLVYEPIRKPIQLSKAQADTYKKLVADGFTDTFYLGKAAALELAIRLQDICNGLEPVKDDEGKTEYYEYADNPKLEALLDLIKEIDDSEQICVWVSRTYAADSIKKALFEAGITSVVYTGQQSTSEKQKAEEAFKNRSARVFIGNIAAAGFGLNALKDCNYMIWYCLNNSAEQYHQAQHRILRGESKTPKFAYLLYCKGTIEERLFSRIKEGEELIGTKNTKEVFAYDAV